MSDVLATTGRGAILPALISYSGHPLMLTFLNYLFGGGLDDQVFDGSTVDSYLHDSANEPDDLALAAVNRGNRATFIQLLAERGLWLVVRLDVAQFEGDVHLLEYEENERRVMPIFSSLYEAWAFIHTIDISQMVPLQYLHVNSLFLTHNDLTGYKVVMNPFAGATTELQEPDVQALRVLWEEMAADQQMG